MLTTCALVAFCATTDAERAKHFYVTTLGLRLVADEPWALVLDARSTMLRIQKVEQLAPAPYTSLGWKVDDLAAYARKLGAAGVTVRRYAGFDQDELGIWTSPDGSKVLWFADPDGHTLSLTQYRSE